MLHPNRTVLAHRPPHDVATGEAVFLTASTLRPVPHLATGARKDHFTEVLFSRSRRFGIDLIAWVVLKEHYHLVLVPRQPAEFTAWIRALHGSTAAAWNQEDGTPGRQVWYQYWDTTLWSRGDLWSRINYVHRNPEKHGYTSHPESWPWSSLAVLGDHWSAPTAMEGSARFPAPSRLPHDDF